MPLPPSVKSPATHTHTKINWELFGELSSEVVTDIAYDILLAFNFLLGTSLPGIKEMSIRLILVPYK